MLKVFSGVVIPIVLSLVPGWGHIWARRPTRGLAIFLSFFAVANLGLIRFLAAHPGTFPTSARLSFATAGAVAVFTFVDIVRITVWLRSPTVKARRGALLRKAVVHYLRNELGQAEEALRRVLRIDPYDVAALYYLGMTQRATGDDARAMATFRKALKVAPQSQWSPDLLRERARTSEALIAAR